MAKKSSKRKNSSGDYYTCPHCYFRVRNSDIEKEEGLCPECGQPLVATTLQDSFDDEEDPDTLDMELEDEEEEDYDADEGYDEEEYDGGFEDVDDEPEYEEESYEDDDKEDY